MAPLHPLEQWPVDGPPHQSVESPLDERRRIVGAGAMLPNRRAGHDVGMPNLDDDVPSMSHDELVDEVLRLREGIRRHRDSTGHDLCWHHPDLWGLLPERTDPLPDVPEWPQFMRGCIRYRQSLDDQLCDARRISVEFDERASGPG
jgi:hypothetical protein